MRLLIVLLPLILQAACGGETAAPAGGPPAAPIPFDKEGTLAFLSAGDTLVTIDIEIADTDSARERGMMQRESFPDRSGMLFIFDREAAQSFWMANTPLALDLIFVSADSQIVNVAKYARPFSSESIPSRLPAQFVVEVPAGFADTHGIVEGHRVRWVRSSEF